MSEQWSKLRDWRTAFGPVLRRKPTFSPRGIFAGLVSGLLNRKNKMRYQMKLFSNFLVVAGAASFIALTGCSSDASDDTTTDSGEVHSDTGHDDHEGEEEEGEEEEGEEEGGEEEGGEEGEE
jgi:hypothetical protein